MQNRGRNGTAVVAPTCMAVKRDAKSPHIPERATQHAARPRKTTPTRMQPSAVERKGYGIQFQLNRKHTHISRFGRYPRSMYGLADV